MTLKESLVGNGYFPKEVPPAFSTKSFAAVLGKIPADLLNKKPFYSKSAYHSIPRLRHVRRLLGIPNPRHQLKLIAILSDNWSNLDAYMAMSQLSRSRVQQDSSEVRALKRIRDFEELGKDMVLSSPGSRYVLKADISRFYPTLYTHSIPWALHTKEVAKAKKKDPSLLGNLIDSATQATQHQQTLGIPVGPDTSDLIAEILGVALDQRMQEVFPGLKGFRYVDDYSLYFTERQEAEAALTALHAATSHFGLEINPNKTDILPMPEAMEPPWKVQLRSLQIRSEDAWEARDLISYFSAAHASAANYPHNQVLKFAVKQTMGTEITPERWPLYESILLTSLVNEPALAPNLATLLRTYEEKGYIIDRNKLRDSLAEVARYHARLRQGFELAWALWMCRLFTIALPSDVFKEISAVEDSFVALIALDLSYNGLADGLDTSTWRKLMTAQNLYDENWLLAYEAFIKGWLPSLDGSNYVGADEFFETLRTSGVEFYDLSISEPTSAAYWVSVY